MRFDPRSPSTRKKDRVAKVDDAAILKRAKALCEEAGVAWDRLSATAPGARVLNDRDRRECLMRARDELMREAETAEELEGEIRHGDVIAAAAEVTQGPNEENPGDLEIPPSKRPGSGPTRRVA
jgi:hypothetical protein